MTYHKSPNTLPSWRMILPARCLALSLFAVFHSAEPPVLGQDATRKPAEKPLVSDPKDRETKDWETKDWEAKDYGEPDYVRYDEGPLQREDFRGAVPETRPLKEPRIDAYSHTELRYQFRSRASRRRNRWSVELVDIEICALFDRTRSWNARPNDTRLLDHHQGHFDLAEIAARDARRQMHPATRRDKPPIGSGSSERAATEDLEQQIQRQFAGHLESLRRDIEYFDQITRYGTLPDVEAREREKQKELLQRSAK